MAVTLSSDVLDTLPEQHRNALEWFHRHTKKTVRWPRPLPDGTRLVTQAKGIYKPEWSEYALSVRETVDSPYADMEPTVAPDGTWIYFYHQEGDGPEDGDRLFTNRSLLNCARARVPVGVMRQVSATTPVQYTVLGLAYVRSFSGGFFRLEGGAQDAFVESLALESLRPRYADFGDAPDDDPNELQAFARRVRRGQRKFRDNLLALYDNVCAVSGTGPTEVLEAVHIEPHAISGLNTSSNGLLLRADLHALFDDGLLRIHPDTFVIHLSDRLRDTEYWQYEGVVLRVRVDGSNPGRKHIRARWEPA